MKVHNDLKELLFDFMNNYENYRLSRPHTIQQMVSDYCSNNSLALGKPEPLAKNKQLKEFNLKRKLTTSWNDETGFYDAIYLFDRVVKIK